MTSFQKLIIIYNLRKNRSQEYIFFFRISCALIYKKTNLVFASGLDLPPIFGVINFKERLVESLLMQNLDSIY
jgi:hypothetical protein